MEQALACEKAALEGSSRVARESALNLESAIGGALSKSLWFTKEAISFRGIESQEMDHK